MRWQDILFQAYLLVGIVGGVLQLWTHHAAEALLCFSAAGALLIVLEFSWWKASRK